MLVQIVSLDNGSGTNSNLQVYKCYNTKQKLTDNRPYCLIDESDFFDLFKEPEKEFDKACNGKDFFNIKLQELDLKCKKIY